MRTHVGSANSGLDLDSCSTNSPCPSGATCVDLFGGRTCICPEGFTFNQNTGNCDNVDECAAGTHDCEKLCVDNHGGFQCACPPGEALVDDTTCGGEIVRAKLA